VSGESRIWIDRYSHLCYPMHNHMKDFQISRLFYIHSIRVNSYPWGVHYRIMFIAELTFPCSNNPPRNMFGGWLRQSLWDKQYGKYDVFHIVRPNDFYITNNIGSITPMRSSLPQSANGLGEYYLPLICIALRAMTSLCSLLFLKWVGRTILFYLWTRVLKTIDLKTLSLTERSFNSSNCEI